MRGKSIEILKDALHGGYGVGAFNTYNLEITQGIAQAAAALHFPCIIQVTTKSLEYGSEKVLGELIKSIIDNETGCNPIGFHLDHGHTYDDIIKAIDVGVDSVMIDGSQAIFKANLKLTKMVVDYAHAKGVAVQAELGRVPYLGREEMEVDWDKLMANPMECKRLVDESGVDALAVGIGNAHGFYRERPVPDWERLKKIRQIIPETPLIIHGASDWGTDKVKMALECGATCFNIDTDIRIAFLTTICKRISVGDTNDPRVILSEGRNQVSAKVKEKMIMFGNGKIKEVEDRPECSL